MLSYRRAVFDTDDRNGDTTVKTEEAYRLQP